MKRHVVLSVLSLLALAACGSSVVAANPASPPAETGDDAGAIDPGENDAAAIDGGAHDGATKDGSTKDGASADAAGIADSGTVCVLHCGAATCGDDGCGGSCGPCVSPQWCGGGGMAGRCGTGGTIPAYPGITPTKIDNGAALGLRAAGDEKHVLVQRTEASSFDKGALAVVTIGATGTASAHELSTAVAFTNGVPRAEFNADSTGLYFVDVSTMPMHLAAASADGTGVHTIVTGIIQSSQVVGNTLVYMTDPPGFGGDRTVAAVLLPSGSPVQLVAPGSVYYPYVTPNPTGTAVYVTDQNESAVHEIIQTATGAITSIGAAGTSLQGLWSPDGAYFAYWSGRTGPVMTVRVVNANGSGDTLITSSAAIVSPIFSPDGTRLAYGTSGTGGKLASITIHPLAGGADVVLTLTTTRYWGDTFLFSGDGGVITTTSIDHALAMAPTDHSGAFLEIAGPLAVDSMAFFSCSFTPAHELAAMLLPTRKLSVMPTAGGTAHALSVPVDQPGFYEPVTSQPRLLAFTSPSKSQSGIYGSLTLYPADGTGPGFALPGQVLPAFTMAQLYHSPRPGWQGADSGLGQTAETFTWGWLGSEVVYEADRDPNIPALDVVASTDTGGTIGVIAPGAQVWAVRDGVTPTRVFFTRPTESGVWWSMVPQTPGR